MLRLRFLVFALVVAFLVQPKGLASTTVFEAEGNINAHLMSVVNGGPIATQEAGHHSFVDYHSSNDSHDHQGESCCSSTGMCSAVLVGGYQIIYLARLVIDAAVDIRKLMSRTVDGLLHPPKIYF